eukprot:828045-Rhodomonas_salina.2
MPLHNRADTSHINRHSCDFCDATLQVRSEDLIVDPKYTVVQEEKERGAVPLDHNGDYIETVVKRNRVNLTESPSRLTPNSNSDSFKSSSSGGSFKSKNSGSQRISPKALPAPVRTSGLGGGVGQASPRVGIQRMGNSSRSVLAGVQ